MLSTERLTKEFYGLTAVSDVSYKIEEGKVLGIIGPNGSGKTTFLNLLSGALPCTRGKIFFDEKDITHIPAHERVKMGISRAFQITNIFLKLTVFQNILVGLLREKETSGSRFMFTSISKYTRIYQEAERILEDTYLVKEKDSLAMNIPHGSQRRLEMAMCLSTKPKLLLLDEPFAGLTAEEIHVMLKFIQEDLATKYTIVIVEHHIHEIMRLAERIMLMKSGKLIAEGTPEELRDNQAAREAYLGAYADRGRKEC